MLFAFRTLVAAAHAAVASLVTLLPASADNLGAHLRITEDRAWATLKISPCAGDEVDECVAHQLSCERGKWLPEFSIYYGPVESIAATLVAGSEGLAEGVLTLSSGTVSIRLKIPAIHLDQNEMDGGWILTVGVSNMDDVFEVLTARNSEGAAIQIGGQMFSVAPQRGDGEKLSQWRDVCREIFG